MIAKHRIPIYADDALKNCLNERAEKEGRKPSALARFILECAFGLKQNCPIPIESRKNRPDEIKAMQDVCAIIPPCDWKKIDRIWCDSSSTHHYIFYMKTVPSKSWMQRIHHAFCLFNGGHNEIVFILQSGSHEVEIERILCDWLNQHDEFYEGID
jgi:hypothetical protein